jgi:predicted N-formylglutamate amidohydrolase
MNLLDAGTPAEIINQNGPSPIVLVCEHASNHIPAILDNLGLAMQQLRAHFAWDIGAEAVARKMSKLLDAPLIVQRYSRLVYDCNRPPEAPSAMPETGEETPIPGNRHMNDEQRIARIEQIYHPFHKAVSQLLDSHASQPPVFVTIHSFTPTFKGKKRTLELGILHDIDARLADTMLAKASSDYISRRNDPYGPEDGVTHTLNLHGGKRGLLNVMLEIRNDLIDNEEGQTIWAKRLTSLLQQALAD